MKLAAAALTTDGSENPATDLNTVSQEQVQSERFTPRTLYSLRLKYSPTAFLIREPEMGSRPSVSKKVA